MAPPVKATENIMTTNRMNPNPIGARGVSRCFSAGRQLDSFMLYQRGRDNSPAASMSTAIVRLAVANISINSLNVSGVPFCLGPHLPLSPVGALPESNSDDQAARSESVQDSSGNDTANHLRGRYHCLSVCPQTSGEHDLRRNRKGLMHPTIHSASDTEGLKIDPVNL
jgi:hypothetical protein